MSRENVDECRGGYLLCVFTYSHIWPKCFCPIANVRHRSVEDLTYCLPIVSSWSSFTSLVLRPRFGSWHLVGLHVFLVVLVFYFYQVHHSIMESHVSFIPCLYTSSLCKVFSELQFSKNHRGILHYDSLPVCLSMR